VVRIAVSSGPKRIGIEGHTRYLTRYCSLAKLKQ
jgi:hypothetical protein